MTYKLVLQDKSSISLIELEKRQINCNNSTNYELPSIVITVQLPLIESELKMDKN